MTTFTEFAELGEKLEATRARKTMAALVAVYLRSVSASEVASAARMVIGRVFPERQGAAVLHVVIHVAKTTPSSGSGLPVMSRTDSRIVYSPGATRAAYTYTRPGSEVQCRSSPDTSQKPAAQLA